MLKIITITNILLAFVSAGRRGLRKSRHLSVSMNTPNETPEANTHPSQRFNIELVNVGRNTCTETVKWQQLTKQPHVCLHTFSCETISTVFDNIMADAAARWEEVIVGDLPNIPAQQSPNFDWFDGYFGSWVPAYNEPVDDVVIGYAFRPKSFFDNSTDTLGRAGAIYIRNFDKRRWAPPMTAVSGTMEFNKDAIRESNYTRKDLTVIVMHEMVGGKKH